MTAPFYRKPSDLPETAPVFPLEGAMLFPRSNLPLNIFEPRYLNMVDDAMRGDRIIGMVQPRAGAAPGETPELAEVGCVGRIVSYTETDDGRYLINLKGACRFRIVAETEEARPYRRAVLDYAPFAQDLKPPSDEIGEMRGDLLGALRQFLARNGMKADWTAVEDAPMETLVNALSAGCPFSSIEKQLLLESPTLRDRAQALAALLRIHDPDQSGTLQ